jgi:hypothetical protein
MNRFGPILIPMTLALGVAGVAAAQKSVPPAAPGPQPRAAAVQIPPAPPNPPAEATEGPWGSKIEPVDAKTLPSPQPPAKPQPAAKPAGRRH